MPQNALYSCRRFQDFEPVHEEVASDTVIDMDDELGKWMATGDNGRNVPAKSRIRKSRSSACDDTFEVDGTILYIGGTGNLPAVMN